MRAPEYLLTMDNDNRIEAAVERLDRLGFVVLPGVLPEELRIAAHDALYRVRDQIETEIRAARIEDARRRGDNAIRFPMAYDPVFVRFLGIEPMLECVYRALNSDAILRFQNGFIDSAHTTDEPPGQRSYHHNFVHGPTECRLSIEVVFALGGDEDQRSIVIRPGTHQPDPQQAGENGHQPVEVRLPLGAMLLFDGRLRHLEPANNGGSDRVTISHQFVYPFIKPHFDFVRALGTDFVSALPEPQQALLGWTSRVPVDLDEFYVPPEQRLYRSRKSVS